MSPTAEQLEANAETHRTHISELIDELRVRTTPGEVVDEFLGWEDGREMARTFGRQVRNNPLPLALIGAGVAWLMISDTRGRYREGPVNGNGYGTDGYGADGYDTASEAMHDGKEGMRRAGRAVSNAAGAAQDYANGLSGAASETASNLSDSAQSAMEGARQSASDLAGKAQSAYGRAKDSVSDAADNVAESTSSAWRKASGLAQNAASGVGDAGTNLNRIAQDQPLLSGGVGFALGMVLGAMLPMTDFEHDLMGEKRDELKERATGMANEQIEKAKTVAQKSFEAATDAAKEEAQNQGLTPAESPEGEISEDGVENPGGENGVDYGSSSYRHH